MSENKNNDEYEDVCYMCRRPESIAGKMIHIPGGISICHDCLQKTFDSMENFNFGGNPFAAFTPANLNRNDAHKNASDSSSDGGQQTDYKEVTDDSTSSDNQQSSGSDNGSNDSGRSGQNGFNNIDLSKMPNISMMNLNDFMNMFQEGGVPQNQRIKKKKEAKDAASGRTKEAPIIDIRNIPPPHKIRERLDEYVVGQDNAKKVMSVAVYNHYKRVISQENVLEGKEEDDGVEIEKSNMLMIGPTGSGKTYLVKTLARLLDVPLAITDATSLTEAGYIGDDIESVVSKLLAAADNDVEKAEKGIIFIDEIDKLAKKHNTNSRDINGEAVQQGMLKLLEGSEIEVPVGANSKNAMVPLTTVDTSNILFICGGAFPDLGDIIKERLNRTSAIGFVSDLKDKYDDDENILDKVTVEDLRKFGMIPEFIGRLPIVFTLQALDEEMLVKILTEPKNAIVKQYQKLLRYDEVDLELDHDALLEIARLAKAKEIGARALRSVIEKFMLDIMYEIPKDDNIGKVTITKDYILGKGSPQIEMRGEGERDVYAIPEKSAATEV